MCAPWRMSLSRKRELQTQAKVLSGGRIAAARKQRRVGLAVVIEAHCEQARQRVVGRERQLERRVAAAGRACHRGNVAADGRLLAVRQVETQVEVGVESGAARAVRR